MKMINLKSYRTKNVIMLAAMLFMIAVRALGDDSTLGDILCVATLVLMGFYACGKYEKSDEYTEKCTSRANALTLAIMMCIFLICGVVSTRTGAKIFNVDMYYYLVYFTGALNSLIYLIIDRPVRDTAEEE